MIRAEVSPANRPYLLRTWCFLPGTSLTRSRQPSRSQDSWWLLVPGLLTNISQRCLVVTCHHCSVSQVSLMCCKDITLQAITWELSQLIWGGGRCPRMICACVIPSPMDHPETSSMIAASLDILRTVKRKSRPLTEKLCSRRNIGASELLQLPSLLSPLLTPQGLGLLCGQRSPCHSQDWVAQVLPSPLSPENTTECLSILKLFFHRRNRKWK